MFKLFAVSVYRCNFFLCFFLSFFISVSVAGNQSLVVEKTNQAFEQCLSKAPVVQQIKRCDNANVCWAKWLAQYEQAKFHNTACVKKYGGRERAYYYPTAIVAY